ncbi:VOC family protein [Rhodocista pekingensis]|uniref:VOC family protein n=1 Tax=Rhodocista pekingensis TaxID=201185 RepID=A0ABW2KXW9_9PROT
MSDTHMLKGVVPYLTVGDAQKAIAFYVHALDAHEVVRQTEPDGVRVTHSVLLINGGTFFVSDDFPEHNGGQSRDPLVLTASPVTLHMNVPNVDTLVQRAVEHGATVLVPPQPVIWGSRFAKIRDPFGHVWTLVTPIPE